jgi:hypothetical protein
MYSGEGFHCSQPAYYRIYVQGALDARWLRDYVDMRIERMADANDQVVTQLTGELVDQSALIGVLSLICGLGAPVLAFECLPYTTSRKA